MCVNTLCSLTSLVSLHQLQESSSLKKESKKINLHWRIQKQLMEGMIVTMVDAEQQDTMLSNIVLDLNKKAPIFKFFPSIYFFISFPVCFTLALCFAKLAIWQQKQDGLFALIRQQEVRVHQFYVKQIPLLLSCCVLCHTNHRLVRRRLY